MPRDVTKVDFAVGHHVTVTDRQADSAVLIPIQGPGWTSSSPVSTTAKTGHGKMEDPALARERLLTRQVSLLPVFCCLC